MSDRPTSSAVRIVTDSACDLPAEVADAWGIHIVPLTIRIDGVDHVDRTELTPTEFWARCNASAELPTTAAPSPGQFEHVFRHVAAEGAEGIVVVSLSGALSATLQSAALAAEAVADLLPVNVVDSRNCTLGQGMIALACARLAADGGTLGEVTALAEHLVPRTHVWGALDTLDNLKKGGRIGGAKALLASALAIKPIIEVRDGRVEQGGKQRTRAKALAFVVETLQSYGPIENLAVLHADCADVDAFVSLVRQHHSGDIVVGDIGPVVGSHAGRGTIGVAFQVR